MSDQQDPRARPGHPGPIGPFHRTREALRHIVTLHASGCPSGSPALHNLPLWGVLSALGFDVTGLAARVVRETAGEAPAPRTHLLLRVELPDAPWVVDAELGGQALLAPLRGGLVESDAAPAGPFRLALAGDEFEVQARVDTGWRPLYRFDLEPLWLRDGGAIHHQYAEAS
jgi:N-hydroxyarylamine O-acetyltransferase